MNIKKLLAGAAAGALMLGSMAVPALAKGPNGPAGQSNQAHLYLYEKNPSDWSIVDGGAWGKMTYNQSGPAFDYVFNGHGLVPDNKYTLIYYPDPWPGTNLQCLGNGTANGGGNVNISGVVNTGSLPIPADDNYPGGAKIWLVESTDVKCDATSGMIGWSPTEYLFENNLINFTSP